MIPQNSYFFKLSRKDQKATVEVLVFSAENPITSSDLYKILIFGEDTKDYKLKFEGNGAETDTDKSENSNLDLNKTSKDIEGNANYDEIAETEQSLQKNETVHSTKQKNDISPIYFEKLIDEINADLTATDRPYLITNVASGYQFATRPEYGKLATQFAKSKAKRRLSQAALETLAIIAYKQPISKPEIEKIRGVNSAEIVNTLIDKNFVKSSGRSDGIGKALLFATTDDFLKSFGLNSLEDLPKLRELEELSQEMPFFDGSVEVQIDEKTGEKIFTFKAVEDSIDITQNKS